MGIHTTIQNIQANGVSKGARGLVLAVAAMLFILLFLFVPSLGGVGGASSIAQGFQAASDDIVSGSLVSAQANSPNTVELSNLDNADLLVGIVGEDSLIELSDGGSAAQVVVSGVASALVSDINGDVNAGDRIAASPIAGVGMKAVENVIIVGIAQEDLSNVDTAARTIMDSQGNPNTVSVGLLPVQVGTVFYAGEQDGSSFVPGFLQDLANTVAGRQVSPVRVLIAALILVLLFVSVVVLLYSATKSSIISIGRNPLSEKAVHKSLFEVGLTVVGIMAFAVILIYLILTI